MADQSGADRLKAIVVGEACGSLKEQVVHLLKGVRRRDRVSRGNYRLLSVDDLAWEVKKVSSLLLVHREACSPYPLQRVDSHAQKVHPRFLRHRGYHPALVELDEDARQEQLSWIQQR